MADVTEWALAITSIISALAALGSLYLTRVEVRRSTIAQKYEHLTAKVRAANNVITDLGPGNQGINNIWNALKEAQLPPMGVVYDFWKLDELLDYGQDRVQQVDMNNFLSMFTQVARGVAAVVETDQEFVRFHELVVRIRDGLVEDLPRWRTERQRLSVETGIAIEK